MTTDTINKSRNPEIPLSKIATQHKSASLAETAKGSEGKEFPNRSTASTSPDDSEQRYRTRSKSGITRPQKLKEYFVFKDNNSNENFDNVVVFKKLLRKNADGVELTLKRAAEMEISPIGRA